MRVLLISPKASGIGGTAQHISGLTAYLRRTGLEVDVVSSENTWIIDRRGFRNPSFSFSSALRTLMKKYDVIHAHNLPSALPMRLALGKRVLTLHGVYAGQVALLHRRLLGFAAGLAENVMLSWADVVTTVSLEAANHYAQRGFQIIHVPNAIDTTIIPEEGISFAERQAVFVGRLSREKGLDILIQAFSKLSTDAKLIVIGDGPDRESLVKMANGDSRIIFLGERSREESLRYIRGSDVFVLPSRMEGLSTALLEAMACGVPVVASQVGGNVELVANGETGILVPPENPNSLSDALLRLLQDDDLSRRLGDKAARVVREKHSWEKVGKLYLKIYESA